MKRDNQCADSVNHRFQMLTPMGFVSLLTGFGDDSFGNDMRTVTLFMYSYSIAVDSTYQRWRLSTISYASWF